MNFKFISKYLNNIIKLFIYIPHLMYIYIYTCRDISSFQRNSHFNIGNDR